MKKLLSLILTLSMLCGACFALASCGGNDTEYTIGICQLTPHPALDAATQGFMDAVKAELGEENINFINQNAQGKSDMCVTICADFKTKNVDLILANATGALQAAYNATETIPILGTSITDYVSALELESFNGTVGGNVSGTSDLAPLDEQAEMIVDLFPEAETVGLLYCSAEPNSKFQIDIVKPLLEQAGKTCRVFTFSGTNDVAQVAQAAAAASDVLYVPTDNTAANCAAIIKNNIADTPLVAGEEGICSGCGVATLSIDYYDLGVATGKMAAKILKGEADVSEMAIEYAKEFTKKYNKERCIELGIDTAALEAKGYVAIATE